mgnify:CR=1 FL=1
MSCLPCPCKDFKEITSADIELVQAYLRRADYRDSDYNIVCLLLWKHSYQIWQYHTADWMLIMGYHDGVYYVMMPLCDEAHFEEAMRQGEAMFHQAGLSYTLTSFTAAYRNMALAMYPDYYVITDRDVADYVYLTDSLRTFSGKKLQKKRNRLNKFYQTYAGRWQYEPIDDHNIEECANFLKGWEQHKEEREETEQESVELNYEFEGLQCIFTLRQRLGWVGGAIRIDGRIRAFLIASRLASDMAQINIEKADVRFDGLYQAVLKEFLKDNFLDCLYLNREDDMGTENLRQSKLAYNPVQITEKYRLTEGKKEI